MVIPVVDVDVVSGLAIVVCVTVSKAAVVSVGLVVFVKGVIVISDTVVVGLVSASVVNVIANPA